jgi:hypothetical protein
MYEENPSQDRLRTSHQDQHHKQDKKPNQNITVSSRPQHVPNNLSIIPIFPLFLLGQVLDSTTFVLYMRDMLKLLPATYINMTGQDQKNPLGVVFH